MKLMNRVMVERLLIGHIYSVACQLLLAFRALPSAVLASHKKSRVKELHSSDWLLCGSWDGAHASCWQTPHAARG